MITAEGKFSNQANRNLHSTYSHQYLSQPSLTLPNSHEQCHQGQEMVYIHGFNSMDSTQKCWHFYGCWLLLIVKSTSSWHGTGAHITTLSPEWPVIDLLAGWLHLITTTTKEQCLVLTGTNIYSGYGPDFYACESSARTTIRVLTQCIVRSHCVPYSIAFVYETHLTGPKVLQCPLWWNSLVWMFPHHAEVVDLI